MGYNDRRWGNDDDRYGRARSDYRGDYRGSYGGGQQGGDDRDDRGFFQRAGDEVRSWFGDEEAERRRQYDERYDDRYDRNDRNRDRSYGSRDYSTYGSGASYSGGSAYGSGQDYGRDQNRGDYGSSRSQGGGRDYDTRDYRSGGTYGRSQGSYGSRDDQSRGRYDNDSLVSGYGWAGDRDRQSQGRGGYGQSQGQGSQHDQSYSSWRDRQMQSFDNDYNDYRRENQSRFENEFSTYRTKRQGQRDLLQKVSEHDEVLGSDGQHVGKVDHVRGDRIKLAKNDQAAGGHHHMIPSSWIDKVEDNKVTISKTADEAKRAWREVQDEDENRNRGMFGQSNSGSDQNDNRSSGDTNLNRSFSGTY